MKPTLECFPALHMHLHNIDRDGLIGQNGKVKEMRDNTFTTVSGLKFDHLNVIP